METFISLFARGADTYDVAVNIDEVEYQRQTGEQVVAIVARWAQKGEVVVVTAGEQSASDWEHALARAGLDATQGHPEGRWSHRDMVWVARTDSPFQVIGKG